MWRASKFSTKARQRRPTYSRMLEPSREYLRRLKCCCRRSPLTGRQLRTSKNFHEELTEQRQRSDEWVRAHTDDAFQTNAQIQQLIEPLENVLNLRPVCGTFSRARWLTNRAPERAGWKNDRWPALRPVHEAGGPETKKRSTKRGQHGNHSFSPLFLSFPPGSPPVTTPRASHTSHHNDAPKSESK